MQKAGDSTQESVFTRETGRGVCRWFPDGFHTQGVDWAGLEEHVLTVPDFAFQTTTASTSHGEQHIPKGVCALHLAVSCSNPTAPLSLIQRLINVNPDALHQTEAQQGWNVLHCALKFNRNIKIDSDNIVDTLLEARPELVCDGATSIHDYGLPPLAYAKCPGLVTKLAKFMPPKLAASILKKIFTRRKLVGASVEAMVQLVREISQMELRQNRSILTTIMPEKLATRQSLVKYVLVQTSKCGRNTGERSDLKHLIDPIIQATYCLHVRTEGDYDASIPCPSAVECLKALLSKKKLGQKALELYSSVMTDNAEYSENWELLEPELRSKIGDATSILRMNSEPSGQPTDCPSRDSALTVGETEESNPSVLKLLKCKEELDAKVEASLDALRQATTALENYRSLYSSTVNKLCNEAQAVSVVTNTNPLPDGRGHDASNWDSTRAAVSLSSNPPVPPKRQKSLDCSGPGDRLDHRANAELSIQDTIENMKAVASAFDVYNKKIAFDSESLVRHQEDLKIVDMKFFRTTFHNQAVQAMGRIAEHQIEKASIQKCLYEIKCQLKETESPGNKELIATRRNDLNARCATLNGESRNITRKIEEHREVVTARRQEVGHYMIKARRLLHMKGAGPANRIVRQRASRFVREAKRETRKLMASLVVASPNYQPPRQQRKKKWKRLHQQEPHLIEQQRTSIEDEELTRMTKRMKL